MKTKGNTILITGGGSGIGRALAESFQALGNEVIIAGRRRKSLDKVTTANPGMKSVTLDIASPVKMCARRFSPPSPCCPASASKWDKNTDPSRLRRLLKEFPA